MLKSFAFTVVTGVLLWLGWNPEPKRVMADRPRPDIQFATVSEAPFPSMLMVNGRDGKQIAAFGKDGNITYLNGGTPDQVIHALVDALRAQARSELEVLQQDQKNMDKCMEGWKRSSDALSNIGKHVRPL
jgi:hypothetical protein